VRSDFAGNGGRSALHDWAVSMVWLEAAASVLLLVAGIVLLRLRWLRRRWMGPFVLIVAWALIVVSLALCARVLGIELGIVSGLLGLSAVAYFIVALGVELRTPKDRSARALAPEPEERRSNWTRAIAKSFLAVVLSGIAAIGIGVAFAIAMPMLPKDRIVIGGILVPILWGAGMAWTLSDARLLRATALLVVVSIVAYGIAFLPKVLS
jgi:hypothetical protein